MTITADQIREKLLKFEAHPADWSLSDEDTFLLADWFNAALVAERKRVIESLRPFVQHKDSCRFDLNLEDGMCRCGLNRALKRPERPGGANGQ